MTKIKLLALLIVSIFTFSFTSATSVFAIQCNEETQPEKWALILSANHQQQSEYLSMLKACVSENSENQAAIDTMAILALDNLEETPADKQSNIADFVMQTLEINARAGYASSQHNYAMLFNERPGSLLTILIKQDQMKFGLWTKMAAAQGEPRAMFNLAMRMAVGLKEAGVARDLETAYTLLILLEQISSNPELGFVAKENLKAIKPFIIQTKANITKTLGKKRAKQLAAVADNFNYSTLAPSQELLVADWDHGNNIRNAIENFLRIQTPSGNEEVLKCTKQCYDEARGEMGLSIKLEYCVAFDAANIEYTSAIYEQLGKKSKSLKAKKLQPEETRKENGIYRIVRELTNAKVDNVAEVTTSLYKQAITKLLEVGAPDEIN